MKSRIDTRRWEGAFAKNAYMFDRDNDGNVALILSGSRHDQDAAYGLRICNVDQREAYASLMFERKWRGVHALSAGLSFNYDYYRFHYRMQADGGLPLSRSVSREAVGAYAQYTLNLDDKVVAMGGVRYDYSDVYGAMVTPRMHVRYNPSEAVTIHASAGTRDTARLIRLPNIPIFSPSSRKIDIAPGLRARSSPELRCRRRLDTVSRRGRGSSFQASTITLIFPTS